MKNTASAASFSKNQVWGIVILIVLILLLIVCWRIIPLLQTDNDYIPQAGIQKEWEAAQKYEKITQDPSEHPNTYDYPETGSSSTTLFSFDPNTASENDFVRLGLSPKVARTILNYRNKGGRFYKKEDFAKIYTLREEDFKRLLPYIHIEGGNKQAYGHQAYNSYPYHKNAKGSRNTYPSKTNEPVYINTCTPEQLMGLRGIGTGYASRILKYRDILGGFIAVEQLKEVYGMNDSLYEAIKDLIRIQPEQIRKININTATEEELRQHPYARNMVKYIILYRKDIGQFKRIEEFRQVPLINEEKYRKIAPYLSL
ncbi:hypothetical protein DBR32_04450 [Taibaiella sp. KBW10]|uniref:ComEA family DNA-binding protein n=1 Tax=Taibaiella sp. KBW10 TaxID=2153357 RepID=UPI000F5B7ED7|nr:helix-hairpin-helix domain-containing protein [Taibaiella sp. KBW10]RQO31225.1 hypothetical protein DBR32_04450 [Taibaiella sp. KBW10]